MKPLIMIVLVLSQFTWSQTKSGTIVVIQREQGKLTVAADSRSVTSVGKHEDSECKIFAFGSKFIFTMTGLINMKNPKWDAPSAAREIWERESKTVISSNPLVQRVVDDWFEAAERVYSLPSVIQDVRKHVFNNPVVATAFFAAIDSSGKLQTRAINIGFDLQLFDATGEVKLIHDISEASPNSLLIGGLGEIATEFGHETTPRAKSYMKWFKGRIANLPLDRQRAEIDSKLVELSILLHPRNADLGFPVDVLQLQEGTGVHWVWRKPNCPEN